MRKTELTQTKAYGLIVAEDKAVGDACKIFDNVDPIELKRLIVHRRIELRESKKGLN